jgi:hypothetical protein
MSSFPKKKHFHNITPELIDGMVPTLNGSGYYWDSQCPILRIMKRTSFGGKAQWQTVYMTSGSGRRVVVNGVARTMEALGFYPEMSIEQAREIGLQRLKLMKEQEINPIDAPPLRQYKKRSPKGIKKRPTEVVPEDILKEVENISPEDADRYEKLMGVLMDAYSQASTGKGEERHAAGRPFDEQDIMLIMDRVGTGFAIGQAIKKLVEGGRLKDPEKLRQEWLGAIVYIAGAILWKDQGGGK